MALLRVPVASTTPGASPYLLNDGASASGPAGGLTPSQLASAYGYDPAAGATGQTVAIVDAFDDPSIEADLGEFDAHYKLAACTTANGCFEKVSQTGSTTVLPKADKTGWSIEITLDVETVHSVCPNCKILLVEAESPSFNDLAEAVREAVKLGATEVSNSYGGAETGLGATERAAYDDPGVVIAASTGDEGYDSWDAINESQASTEMPNAPASLPSVVAVGGTSLELNAGGTRAKETVWNNNGPGDEVGLAESLAEGATGGGCSTVFTAPSWQHSAPGFAATGCGEKRLAADVAAVADPDTGFDIHDTYKCGRECEAYGIGKGTGWVTVGGTSLSAPLITALYALAGGAQGVSDPALTLYGHLGEASSLYDVTEGGNGFCDAESLTLCDQPTPPNSRYGKVDCEGTTACNAAPGFDGPSGVGTPNGLNAFKALRPTAVIAPPGPLEPGVAASFSAAQSSDPYPGGLVSSYSWNWGDGTAHTSGVSPTHTFAGAGIYVVTLTVTDNYGLTSPATTRSVTVGEPTPEEEEAAKRKHEEEEAAARKAHEEELAKKKREEEAAARKAHEEELAKKKREEEAAARKAHEEEAAKKKQEEEAAARKAHEEEVAKKQREEEALAIKTHEEEAAKKKQEEEALAKGKHEEEAPAKKAGGLKEPGEGIQNELGELLAKRQHEEEAAATRKQAEEAAMHKREEEAAVTRRREEEQALSRSGVVGAVGFQALLAPPAPDAQLARTVLQVSSAGTVSLEISCPAGETSCAGTVSLRTLGPVLADVRRTAKGKAAVLTLAAGSFTVAGGKMAILKLRLTLAARALLARSHVLRARATVLAHDPAGATHAGQTIVTLHPAPRTKRPGKG